MTYSSTVHGMLTRMQQQKNYTYWTACAYRRC